VSSKINATSEGTIKKHQRQANKKIKNYDNWQYLQ
jgi:hypothetical protein